METFLVTGAAGFIGSNIVQTLLGENARVIAVDNFYTGRRENIEPFMDRITFYEESITDHDTMNCIFTDNPIDYVLHQAAIPSVQRSIENPRASAEVNINGTLNMLLAAKNHSIKKFVFASSSSVYGDTPTLPKTEGMPPAPKSPYALTKLTGEYYCRMFATIYELPTIALRYFNVFGPNQDPSSQYSAAIPLFISRLLAGKNPIVYGDGEQSRDFTFIQNVVSANLLAARSAASGKVFNVSTGQRITINEVIASIQQKMNTNQEITYQPARTGDVKHSLGDISRTQAGIGYRPLCYFEEGLEKSIEWYKQHV